MPADYADVIRRTSIPKTCPNSRNPGAINPGLGGDSVVLASGNDQRIFDIGDTDKGPTIANHDRLYIKQASPDKFTISRAGHSLLMCAPGEGYSVVILRQYCGSKGQAPLWNNSIEQITFMSGETWLSDELYAARNSQALMTAKLIKEKALGKVSPSEIAQWRYYPFSEKLPRPGNAEKACRADEAMMQSRGLME